MSWRGATCASAFLTVVALAGDAAAQTPSVSGIEVEGTHEDDGLRTFGEVVLFIPRHVVEFLYLGTSAAIAVVSNEPVVPRVQQFVSAPGGRLYVLPTLFTDTNATFNIGARLIVDHGFVASGLRVGFGGPNSFEFEPRVAFRLRSPFGVAFNLEGLYRRDNDTNLRGLGQEPATDPRNDFLPGKAGEPARYFEERARWIVSAAARPAKLFEVILSGSVDRRRTDDARNTDEDLVSEVFVPGSIYGTNSKYSLLYGEAALRFDARPTRGKPSAGALAEAYAGVGRSVEGLDAELIRYGGRIAGFIPIYRKTNILGIRLVADGVAPVSESPLPFQELTRQPDFRGIDDRRDEVSLVGSIDYRWLVKSPIAARLFVDAALVAPAWDDFQWDCMRWATGFAFDIHSDEEELGQVGFAAGPDGARLVIALGIASGYGDRTHRK